MSGQSSLGRRLLVMALRLVGPVFMTAVAAVLGYCLAVYPIWYHVAQVRKTETLGGMIPAAARESALGAYYKESGVTAAAFDHLLWAVRTVMTPFVGYGAAPGKWHSGSIDAFQFRGTHPFTMPKPAGVTRIFLVGASVAFSAGAEDEQRTIGGYLESLLTQRGQASGQRYEVFTCATPAWSSTHERIAIENRLSELEPDLVVELTGVADAFYGERGQNILWARALTDQYYWELVNIALTQARLDPMTDVQDHSPNPVPPELVAARLRKNVELAAHALSLSKARLHVFLQPSVVTTGKRLSEREKPLRFGASGYFRDAQYHVNCYTRIHDVFTNGPLPGNVSYTNLSGMFDRRPQAEDVFLDSYHFGDRGNDLIAHSIAEALK